VAADRGGLRAELHGPPRSRFTTDATWAVGMLWRLKSPSAQTRKCPVGRRWSRCRRPPSPAVPRRRARWRRQRSDRRCRPRLDHRYETAGAIAAGRELCGCCPGGPRVDVELGRAVVVVGAEVEVIRAGAETSVAAVELPLHDATTIPTATRPSPSLGRFVPANFHAMKKREYRLPPLRYKWASPLQRRSAP